MNSIVIFGASGDLTSRKLVPALYQLFRKGRLKQPLRVVGFSRSPFSHDQWRTRLAESTAKFAGKDFDADKWATFAQQFFYHPGDIGNPDDFAALGRLLDQIEGSGPCGRV
ncbi:MAG: glucose-6-phosphate dehydrogenase, partial [Planctomycetes bacterium]|nr:glucose-6-phosphate dehydrogenase [Planctomycetota bacterium]